MFVYEVEVAVNLPFWQQSCCNSWFIEVDNVVIIRQKLSHQT